MRTLIEPTPVKLRKEYVMCLFRCLGFLYRISTFTKNSSLVTKKSNVFYVLIISIRKKSSFPYINKTTFIRSAFSTRKYYSANYHSFHNHFNLKRNTFAKVVTFFKRPGNKRKSVGVIYY